MWKSQQSLPFVSLHLFSSLQTDFPLVRRTFCPDACLPLLYLFPLPSSNYWYCAACQSERNRRMCNLNQSSRRLWHAEWFICNLSPIFTEEGEENVSQPIWCGGISPSEADFSCRNRWRIRWGGKYLDALFKMMRGAHTAVICVYCLMWVMLLLRGFGRKLCCYLS